MFHVEIANRDGEYERGTAVIPNGTIYFNDAKLEAYECALYTPYPRYGKKNKWMEIPCARVVNDNGEVLIKYYHKGGV